MPSQKPFIARRIAIIALLGFAPLFGDGLEDRLSAQAELSRKTVNLGTHKATYIRITPPQLPPLPAKPAPIFRELTPEEKAEEEAQAAKTHEPLGFSCTVYVGTPTVTELVWWSDGKPYRA